MNLQSYAALRPTLYHITIKLTLPDAGKAALPHWKALLPDQPTQPLHPVTGR
jgi:hypothetical protein